MDEKFESGTARSWLINLLGRSMGFNYPFPPEGLGSRIFPSAGLSFSMISVAGEEEPCLDDL